MMIASALSALSGLALIAAFTIILSAIVLDALGFNEEDED